MYIYIYSFSWVFFASFWGLFASLAYDQPPLCVVKQPSPPALTSGPWWNPPRNQIWCPKRNWTQCQALLTSPDCQLRKLWTYELWEEVLGDCPTLSNGQVAVVWMLLRWYNPRSNLTLKSPYINSLILPRFQTALPQVICFHRHWGQIFRHTRSYEHFGAWTNPSARSWPPEAISNKVSTSSTLRSWPKNWKSAQMDLSSRRPSASWDGASKKKSSGWPATNKLSGQIAALQILNCLQVPWPSWFHCCFKNKWPVKDTPVVGWFVGWVASLTIKLEPRKMSALSQCVTRKCHWKYPSSSVLPLEKIQGGYWYRSLPYGPRWSSGRPLGTPCLRKILPVCPLKSYPHLTLMCTRLLHVYYAVHCTLQA